MAISDIALESSLSACKGLVQMRAAGLRKDSRDMAASNISCSSEVSAFQDTLFTSRTKRDGELFIFSVDNYILRTIMLKGKYHCSSLDSNYAWPQWLQRGMPFPFYLYTFCLSFCSLVLHSL